MSIGPASQYGLIILKACYITSHVRQGTISREAKKRLMWMDHFNRHDNARLTCRYFGISPQIFYRWKNRFDHYDLRTLKEESRRPRLVRRPQTPVRFVERIQKLREQYPRWGKEKPGGFIEERGNRDLWIFSGESDASVESKRAISGA